MFPYENSRKFSIKTMREELVKLERVKKACKISKILCTILAWIVTVAFVCAVIGMIIFGVIDHSKVNSAVKEAMESNDVVDFDVDDINIDGMLRLNVYLNEMAEQENYAAVIIVAFAYGATISATLAVILWMLVSIFKIIAISDTPFTANIRNRLKAIFIIVTVIAAFANGLGTGIIIGCIGWGLYTIFDYGFAIQQEIDETL